MSILKKYISPYFIVRQYIRSDIYELSKHYKFKDKILDIGCGNMPYKYLFPNSTYIGIDFDKYSVNKDAKEVPPDHIFPSDYIDTLVLPFDNEQFDNVVAFQVMEHHINPEKMLQEAFRILKSQGKILITIPFIEPIHESPNDFQRFTEFGLKAIFTRNRFVVNEIKRQGSLASSLYLVLAEELNHFASKSTLKYIFSVILYLGLLPLQYLALVLDKVYKSEYTCMNYIVIATKSNES